MKVTIKDVVKASGLSYATVSRAIRNDASVKEKNRKIVHDAMKAIGYVPSAAARTLVTGKTFVVAILISDLGDDYYNKIIKDVHFELLKKGYLLSVTICEEGDVTESAFIQEDRVDGVILMVPGREAHFVKLLQAQQVPFIVVDNQSTDSGIASIQSDDVQGGYLAVQHLMEMGHSKVGLIGGPKDSLSSINRYQGACRALAMKHIVASDYCMGNYDQRHGYSTVMAWHKENRLPTAIFAFDDHIAVGAINGLKDLGLKVPEDISVCGFDDSDIANQYVPRLTSVHQPTHDMAQASVSQLMLIIEGNNQATKAMKLEPLLVRRDSVIAKA